MEKQYHIGIDSSHGAAYAILPGDPDRVEKIAAHLDEPRFLARNREYTSWIGSLKSAQGAACPVLVMSTGMGGPSTAIAVEELYQCGVRNFIRVGTCGGMALPVCGGDLVIATGAIRMEGLSKEYVPVEFPAVANIDITNALIAAAQKTGANTHAGIVQSKDSFYGQHDPERMPAGAELRSKWDAWKKAGALASEMECAALFIVSQILGARTGAVLSVMWNQERARAGLDNPACADPDLAMRAAVEAVRMLL